MVSRSRACLEALQLAPNVSVLTLTYPLPRAGRRTVNRGDRKALVRRTPRRRRGRPTLVRGLFSLGCQSASAWRLALNVKGPLDWVTLPESLGKVSRHASADEQPSREDLLDGVHEAVDRLLFHDVAAGSGT